jgi:hypothetical protein
MEAAAAGQKIAVSSISVIEIVYLVDKSGMAPSAYSDLLAALRDPEGMLVEQLSRRRLRRRCGGFRGLRCRACRIGLWWRPGCIWACW